MLRIKTIRGGAAAAARYYSRENERRPDEYYGREADIRPTWWSPGETFGVKNGADVQPDEVKRALEGRDPAGSGRSLVQAQPRRTVLDKRTGERKPVERRCAYDLNMSLPKSASIIFGAADRQTRAEMLAEARGVAVQVLDHMQRQGHFVARQGKGGEAQGAASDVLALVDVHQSNRDGGAFLHVHAVVPNFGRRSSDGQTATLNDRPLHLAAAEAGALFRAGMAAALERRGLGIERVAGTERERAASFRIAGVSPELEQGGRKAKMIEYVVAKHGAVSRNPFVRRKQMQQAAEHTRGNKAAVPVGEALERRWQEAMRAQGHPPERIWQDARAAARSVERPSLSAAEAVALRIQRSGGEPPDARTVRLRVAVEAQYRGIGVAGAVAEMARMERDGWQQVAREAERHQSREGMERAGEGLSRAGLSAVQQAAELVAGRGLLAAFTSREGAEGGGDGVGEPTPARRRRRGGQERER